MPTGALFVHILNLALLHEPVRAADQADRAVGDFRVLVRAVLAQGVVAAHPAGQPRRAVEDLEGFMGTRMVAVREGHQQLSGAGIVTGDGDQRKC